MNMLNDAQRLAVTSNDPRILCLAGAGTGKTKTLISRVARLLEEGTDPKSIAVMTFTRAAAREMKERLVAMVGDKAEGVYLGTFHAWACQNIREFARLVGYAPNFSIYDQEDTESIVTKIIEDMDYKDRTKDVLAAMEGRGLRKGNANEIIEEYLFICRQQNAIDINHILPTFQKLLRRDMIKKVFHVKYKHIMVDEMQDTDPMQMEIIEMIDPENLFVVGDDHQSIYGFRGAEPRIIMSLAQNPEYTTIKLEENYRSTEKIISAANSLIKHNNQTEKTLTAHRNGPEITQKVLMYPNDEIDWIAGMCIGGRDIAVLTRTNRQLDWIASRLESEKIPYQRRNSADDILKSEAARKITAWMQAIKNPQDNEAIMSIINWPEQNLTPKEMVEAELYALEYECTMITALGIKGTAQEFLDTYNEFQKYETATEMINEIIALNNLREYYDLQGLRNRIEKINNFIEFVTAWEKTAMVNGEPSNPTAWIDYYKNRLIEPVEIEAPDPECVQLMTIHGSKGLEFETVIIAGLNEKQMPLARADIEEERRLFYVGITRAKTNLHLSRSTMRNVWGDKLEPAEPSRFLDEILS